MYLWELEVEGYFFKKRAREVSSEREIFLVEKFTNIAKRIKRLMSAITPSNCVDSLKTIIKEEGKLNLCLFYLTEEAFDNDHSQLNELEQRIEKDYMDYLAFIDSKTQFECDQFLLLNTILAEKNNDKEAQLV
ncbi:hypothetical protein BAU15_14550 [Enterococcus sp. JM4C]|uniref:hypothetical protein n=1 Tax=Candidatus Enterococcus huntleyi TaxID=1857217 RepID=UPI0013796723|nr:hypothetical protein [Enterococcus sp. JM4C]KAF1296918.1 hypothetical protein BAU15_14550 [Enterococcus sp. JM4C]